MAKKTASDEFLVDCEPYFLDGVRVIAQVTLRTYEIVSDAVERQWASLEEALGFQENQVARSEYWFPDKFQKADPASEVCVGVKLKAADFEAAIYKYWDAESNITGVAVYTWITGRQRLDKLTESFDNLPDVPPGEQEPWEYIFGTDGSYFIRRKLPPSGTGALVTALDELITYYIRLISKVGGVKRFLE